MTEGTIPFEGGETWYRIVGDGEEPGKLPLLALHGGPGALHDYLEPLEALAATGRRVDLLRPDRLRAARGSRSRPTSGRSSSSSARCRPSATRSGSTTCTSSARRGAAMLAMEYALTQPTGVASLVLSSGPASIPLWAEETNRLKNELPDDVREVLDTAGDRLARVRGGDDGVLQAPRLPGRPVPGLRPAHVRRTRRAPRRLHAHAGPERVRDHRDAEGLGHHGAARRDRRCRR